MRVVLEHDHGVPRVRVNPRCEMYVNGWGEPDKECGKRATKRVKYRSYWTKFWCPEHAAMFQKEDGVVAA